MCDRGCKGVQPEWNWCLFPILRNVVTREEAMDTDNARRNMTDTAEQVFRIDKSNHEWGINILKTKVLKACYCKLLHFFWVFLLPWTIIEERVLFIVICRDLINAPEHMRYIGWWIHYGLFVHVPAAESTVLSNSEFKRMDITSFSGLNGLNSCMVISPYLTQLSGSE